MAASRTSYAGTTATNALVTGSSSFAGTRLVILLLERGARNVVCFDFDAPGNYFWEHYEAFQHDEQQHRRSGGDTGGKVHIFSGMLGDVTSCAAVDKVFRRFSFDVVFHMGTSMNCSTEEKRQHRQDLWDTNIQGTRNILEACERHEVNRLVFASSIWTRYDASSSCFLGTGSSDNRTYPKSYISFSAKSMAAAEAHVLKVCQVVLGRCASGNAFAARLATVAVAPSPILYGPNDGRFLPPLLHAAKDGTLRIFGLGQNSLCMCHVDNYCHGLLCAADALLLQGPTASPSCSGKLYIVSDGGLPVNVWRMINEAVLAMEFDDLRTKWNVPLWMLHLCTSLPKKLLECFFVPRLLCWWWWLPWLSKEQIRAYSMSERGIFFSDRESWGDIGYQPIVGFEQGWATTIEWYRTYWLPVCQDLQDSGAS